MTHPETPTDIAQRTPQLLYELVRRYSPYGHETEVAQYLVSYMRDHGITAHIDDAGNAIGIINPASPASPSQRTLMFIGHMDVYPGELDVSMDDEIIAGRGSVDAKGCIAMAVSAAINARDSGQLSDDTSIIIACCVQEEGPSSKGARYLCTQPYSPDCIIIGEPSGSGSITLGYKGILSFGLTLSQDNFHYGADVQRVTDRAIRFTRSLMDFIDSFRKDAFFDSPSCEIRAINSTNDGITETCSLSIAIRIPPQFDTTLLKAYIRQIAGPEGDEIVFSQDDPAYVEPLTTPYLHILRKQIKHHGGAGTFKKKLGTSDNVIVGPHFGCPTFAYGPGDSKLDHTPQEHQRLDELCTATSIFSDFICAFATR